MSRSKPPLLDGTFVFSGFAKLSADGRSLEPEPRSLEPVRHLVFFTEDPRVAARPGDLAPWITDAKGLLYPAGSKFAAKGTLVHYLGRKRTVRLPPPEMLLYSWAARAEGWAETLGKFLASEGCRGIELVEQDVYKRHLQPPGNDGDDDYRKWYDRLGPDAPVRAFVLPKTRAIVCMFSSPLLVRGTLRARPPDSTSRFEGRIVPTEGLASAVIAAPPAALPTGLYAFEIDLPPDATPKGWSPQVWSTRSYRFKEMVRFGITNFAGELDVVVADPISVEEAVMVQHAPLYAHLITAGRRQSSMPELEQETTHAPVPSALASWSERLGWTYDKAKLSVKLVNASGSSARAKVLGKAVWDAIRPTDPLLAAAKNTIDLAFGVKENLADWGKLRKLLAAEEDLQGAKEVLWRDIASKWRRSRFWSYLKEEHIERSGAKILELANLSDAERAALYRAGIPEKPSNLEKTLGRTGKLVEQGIVAVDTALSFYQVAKAVSDIVGTAAQLRSNQRDLETLLGQLDSELDGWPCREAFGNLERLRTATVTGKLDLSEAGAAAVSSAVDAALGVLALIPVTAEIAALVTIVKTSAELAIQALGNGAEWLDRAAFDGLLQALRAEADQLDALLQASYANQALMPDPSATSRQAEMHRQLRLRAEAVQGLVGLLQRAGLAASSPQEYLEKVREYRVAEYVDMILLGKGWQMPLRPLVPISLDTFWLYLNSPLSGLQDLAALRSHLGITKPLTLAAMTPVPGATLMLAVADTVLQGHAEAAFHEPFPIHRLEADGVDSLAKALKPAWREMDRRCIAYSCVYWRPEGSKHDDPWQPVNPQGHADVDELRALSPLDHVRILVVLDDKVERAAYPMSLQVYRTDTWNVEGPIYKEIARPLDPYLLPSESTWQGRLGCVFYPFYQLGSQTLPGLKPLAGPGLSLAGKGLYTFLNGLTDMRYGFEVKVGGERSRQWLRLGAANNGKSDLDELKVTLRGSGDERQLMVPTLLRSHTSASPYPTLFTISHGAGPCYARAGGHGPYRLASAEQNAALVFTGFDWQSPVELVVVVWTQGIAHLEYEQAGYDWKRVPMRLQLVNLTGIDRDGPTYDSTLTYMGKLQRGRGGRPPSLSLDPPAQLSDALRAWVTQVHASPQDLTQFDRAVDPRGLGGLESAADSYRLYAAHFRLRYVLPGGKEVDSIRPFGAVLEAGQTYRYAVRNLTTAEKSGLSQRALEAELASTWTKPAGYVRHEYEFHFPAPARGQSVPWASLPREHARRWIEDDAAKIDPNLEIVAP